ncbi:MAG: DUF5522 domain-containing protein [Actinomycetota bacterium]
MRPDFVDSPLPERCSPRQRRYAEVMARHRAAVDGGIPAYLDPTSGLAVFTAQFLADRGYCCGNGCRHCPYERN